MSGLADRLAAGRFTVTAELSPVRGASAEAMLERGRLLASWVDAVNLTDNQGAHVRMSAWACALAVRAAGLEPVMQMTCRDRNRIALQSDLLGAASAGLRNLVFMTGDHPKFGDHPGAKPVFDLDSVTMLWTARTMRDEGRLLSGKELKPPPSGLFLGAVENPFAPPEEFRAARAAKKIAAGAQFIQTQYVFDVATFGKWVAALREEGLTSRCFILAGVGVIRSARALDFLASGRVPGVVVPEGIQRRLRGAGEGNVEREGHRLAAEVIAQVSQIPGVAGVHLLTAGYEKRVPELLELAGVADGRGPGAPGPDAVGAGTTPAVPAAGA
ncbi:MAG TPA: methylenetetrahydrofolate reductase [Trebonia sp.]|nr:methylenetetrahydrofolate reductase [Trebonia sp.]